MSKEITTTQESAVALPFKLSDFNAGLEETDRDSFAIPFLRVIQKTSPQVDEAKPEFNPAAKPGMLVNSITGELYDGKAGIIAMQCAYQRRYTRWDASGGFKGELLPDDVAQMEASGQTINIEGKLTIGGDELTDNRYHYLLVVGDNSVSHLLLSLASTQIKKSKQLMSMLSAVKVRAKDNKLVTPPTWYTKIKISTQLESNDKGSWYGLKFETAGTIESQELYDLAKGFHDDVTAGVLKATSPEPTEENKF